MCLCPGLAMSRCLTLFLVDCSDLFVVAAADASLGLRIRGVLVAPLEP